MTSAILQPARWLTLIWCGLVFTGLTGCSTYSQRVRTARDHFYAGRLADAGDELQRYCEAKPDDADAASLDLAMVQLLDGRPADAEATLREVRDSLDFYDQADAGELAVSMVTDDQQLAYAGANYERVLCRVFLALANLLHDGQDAEAYSLQVNARQQELLQQAREDQVENAEATYAPLAIGAYLHGMLRESTFGNYDDAARAYHQVVSWRPQFQAGKIDLERAQTGVHSAPGHGVLYVFLLVNRGPARHQVAEIPTSAALLVADRILSAVGEYDVPPTLSAIKIPKVFVPPREIESIALSVDGRPVGRSETICDIADLAYRQEEAELPQIMGRAVARRVLKKSAIYATKDMVEADHPLADLGLSAVGVLWEATEAADTRCWGLLPREIQVLRLELPAGQHVLRLDPVLLGSRAAAGPETTVSIADGQNTYLLACFPGRESVGRLVQR
jgi:hypothetical protein